MTLALLVIVAVDCFTLKPGNRFDAGAGSIVANRIGSLREPLPRAHTISEDRIYGWVPSEDNLIRIEQLDAFTWASVSARHSVTRSGFWALTREDVATHISVSIEVKHANAPADLQTRALDLFSAEMREEENAFWVGHIKAIEPNLTLTRTESRALWNGYLRNASSLVGIVGLLLSLGWIARPWRVRRRWIRLGRGLCMYCGYQIGSASAAAPCPECSLAQPERDRTSRTHDDWGADRVLGRIGRSLRRPVVMVLLLALLAHDWLTLPMQENRVSGKSGSRARSWLPVPPLRADAGDGATSGVLYVAVMPGSGKYEWTLNYSDLRIAPNDDLISIKRDTWSNGLWAPVDAGEIVRIDWNGHLGGRSRAEGRSDMVAFLRANQQDIWASEVEEDEGGLRYSVLRIGYVHNAMAIGAALSLVISMGWLLDRRRASLGRRRARAGRCGYCLASSESDAARCDVCGKPRDLAVSDWSRSP